MPLFNNIINMAKSLPTKAFASLAIRFVLRFSLLSMAESGRPLLQ